MRITNRALVKGYLSDLNTNLQNMRKLQEQLSSGREIRRPSDDPFRVARTMELSTGISLNERYQKNIDEGIGWLETSEIALGQMGDVIQRIRELTVQGGNGSYNEAQRNPIKLEIEQLKEQLIQIGNTAYEGRYIFGGDKTTNPPFIKEDGEIKYIGSENNLLREFSQGVTMGIGVSGNCFNNLFVNKDNVVDKIINKLNNNESPDGILGELDSAFDGILNLRAEVGAKSQRLKAMKEKNDEETFNMTELLSKTADIDIAEKVMQYKVMESVYTASLQTGAKILQPSLLDFLR